MTFLKKFGQTVLKGIEIVLGFAPVFEATLPHSSGIIQKVSKDLTEIATVITDVEVIGQGAGMTGAQKLAAAGPQVAQVILDSAVLAGKKIADPALFQRGSQKISDGMADVINSLHEDGVQSTSKT